MTVNDARRGDVNSLKLCVVSVTILDNKHNKYLQHSTGLG